MNETCTSLSRTRRVMAELSESERRRRDGDFLCTHSLHVHACVSQASKILRPPHSYKRTTAADAKPRANKKEDDEEGKEVLAKRCRGNKLLLQLDARS